MLPHDDLPTNQQSSIESRQFYSLLKVFLLTDLRATSFGRSTGSSPKSVVSPLFWVVGQNLLVGMIPSLVLYARVDAFFFAAVHLALSMILTATTLLAEFNEVVVAPDDLEIIGPQPVKAGVYASARLANLFIYLVLVIASLNVFPAIIGCGLTDSDWTFFPRYCFATTVGSFVVSALVILFCLLQRGSRLGQAFQDLMAWGQVGAILILFYGGQLMLRDGQQGLQWFAYQLPGWFRWTPPAWLASVVHSSRGLIPLDRAVIAGLSVAVLVTLWALVLARMTKQYAKMEKSGSLLPSRVRPLPRPGLLLPASYGWVTGDSKIVQSAYWFAKSMFARDTTLKMRCWSSFSVVIAMVACGWMTSSLADPFLEFQAAAIPSAMSIYLISAPLPAIFHNLKYSNQDRSRWVFETAPIGDFSEVVTGVRRFVLMRFFGPLWLAMTVAFAIAWRDPIHAFLQTAAGWCVVVICSQVCSAIQIRRWPATEPMTRGESLGPILPLLSAVGVTVGFLGAMHLAVAPSPVAFSIYLGVLIGLAVLSRKVTGFIMHVSDRSMARGVRP